MLADHYRQALHVLRARRVSHEQGCRERGRMRGGFRSRGACVLCALGGTGRREEREGGLGWATWSGSAERSRGKAAQASGGSAAVSTTTIAASARPSSVSGMICPSQSRQSYHAV